MLSRPDFLKKQVIFLESKDLYKIKFRNSNVVCEDENNKVVMQHTCHRIFIIFVYGEFTITSVMIRNAKKYGFPIIFLNYSLKPYFSILPNNKGNFLLRKKQYTYNKNLKLSKHIVKNKILNQKRLMLSLRYRTVKENKSIAKVDYLLNHIDNANTNGELLGMEGNASKEFFRTYFKNMNFKGRKPRCKTDIINLLLDIGYHYLFNFIEANLELYGFDTYCGVYHKFFFQRKSLVCDIIEPFRCIIDRRVRKSYNLKQINEKEFGFRNGQYYVKRKFAKKYSKLFLKEILEYKEPIFTYVQKYYRAFMKDLPIEHFPVFEVD